MQTSSYIAHVDQSASEPHLLEDHLREVARLAEGFAAKFGSGDCWRMAANWHDLGKFGRDFQNYIRSSSGFEAHLVDSTQGKVNHSSAGALQAMTDWRGRVLAYLIAGHHAGLADWFADETGAKALEQRLAADQQKGLLEHALGSAIPAAILKPPLPTSLPQGGSSGLHLWIRLFFSSLVDADFLDSSRGSDC
jgi:CRISPR-associated endonuclease/helicase Cas3